MSKLQKLAEAIEEAKADLAEIQATGTAEEIAAVEAEIAAAETQLETIEEAKEEAVSESGSNTRSGSRCIRRSSGSYEAAVAEAEAALAAIPETASAADIAAAESSDRSCTGRVRRQAEEGEGNSHS